MSTLAPSSLLVAVFCGACGLPLVDAVSIETGIGPVCRRKHGYENTQADANWPLARLLLGPVACLDMAEVGESRDWAHAVANRICHRVAVFQDGPDVARMVQGLATLGFRRMAARVDADIIKLANSYYHAVGYAGTDNGTTSDTTDDIAAALFRCVVSVYVSDAATRASAGAVTTAAARVAAAFEQTTSTSADGKHRLDVREVSVEVASDPATNHATRTVAVNVTGVAVRDSGNSFEDLIT